MFPYPSGSLHAGHLRVYTISDTVARFQRACGKRVLHPIGWDSFGLPAENAAMERGADPAEWTAGNIAAMREELERLGTSFDWGRSFATSDPAYYRRTQMLFGLLARRGLAYRAEAEVWWDPVDQTVLANEQVDDEGRAWRSGAVAERRKLWQWFIRTTAFSEELDDQLVDALAWQEERREWFGAIRRVAADGMRRFGGSGGSLKGRAFGEAVQELAEDIQTRVESPEEAAAAQVVEEVQSSAEASSTQLPQPASLIGPKRVSQLREHPFKVLLRDAEQVGLERPASYAAAAAKAVQLIAEHLADVGEEVSRESWILVAGRVIRPLREAPTLAQWPAEVLQMQRGWIGRQAATVHRGFVRVSSAGTRVELCAYRLKSSEVASQKREQAEGQLPWATGDRLPKHLQRARMERCCVAVVDALHPLVSSLLSEPAIAGTSTGIGLAKLQQLQQERLASASSGVAAVSGTTNDFSYVPPIVLPVQLNLGSQSSFRLVAVAGVASKGLRVPQSEHRLQQTHGSGKATFDRNRAFALHRSNPDPTQEAGEEGDATHEEFTRAISSAESAEVMTLGELACACGIRSGVDLSEEDAQDFLDTVSDSSEPQFNVAEDAAMRVRHLRHDESRPVTAAEILNDIIGFHCDEDETKATSGGDMSSSSSREASELPPDEAIPERGAAVVHMRDWLVSRQRAWGTPIPVVHCDACGPVLLPDHHLPVKLPALDTLRHPQGPGGSEFSDSFGARPSGSRRRPAHEDDSAPLSRAGPEWGKCTCPRCLREGAQRDVHTLDTFVDSSWYFHAFPDPEYRGEFAKDTQAALWSPVDMYVGGVEHATTHLLYARFIHRFLANEALLDHSPPWVVPSDDLAAIRTGTPFKRLVTQGMVLGQTWTADGSGRHVTDPQLRTVLAELAKAQQPGRHGTVASAKGNAGVTVSLSFSDAESRGLDLSAFRAAEGDTAVRFTSKWEKMSKSKGNGVNAGQLLQEHGADAARLLVLFLAPPHKPIQWSDDQLAGVRRWLGRIASFVDSAVADASTLAALDAASADTDATLDLAASTALDKVTVALNDTLSFNVAIAELMTLTNVLADNWEAASKDARREALLALLRMLSPMAPVEPAEWYKRIIAAAPTPAEAVTDVHAVPWGMHVQHCDRQQDDVNISINMVSLQGDERA